MESESKGTSREEFINTPEMHIEAEELKWTVTNDGNETQGQSGQIDSMRIIAGNIEEINKLPRGLSKKELYKSKYLRKLNKYLSVNFALIEGAGVIYLIMLIISHLDANEISFKEQLGDKMAVWSMASIGVLAITLIITAVSYKLLDPRPLGIVFLALLIIAIFSLIRLNEYVFLIVSFSYLEMYMNMLKCVCQPRSA